MSKKDIFNGSKNDNSTGFSFEPLPAEEGGDDYLMQEKNAGDLGKTGKPEKKKSPTSRLLLLVLLLVVLGGAGFYLYLDMFESPTPPPAPTTVEKTPIAVPPKPEMAAEPVPVPEPPAESASVPVAEEVKTETLSPPEPSEKPAAVVSIATTEAPIAAATAPPSTKIYTVQAGAFLLKSNLERSRKKIRALGYEPKVTIKEKLAPVTRLRVGDFSATEAEAKRADIAPFAPDAFTVREGDRVILYAGSYLEIDRARSISDKLYEKGIQLVEETVELPQPLHILSFGEFPDIKSAREAATRAKKAGMDVFVTKTR